MMTPSIHVTVVTNYIYATFFIGYLKNIGIRGLLIRQIKGNLISDLRFVVHR